MTTAAHPKLAVSNEFSMKIDPKSKKAFLRWVSKGDERYQALVQYALKSLLPTFEDAGIEWVETTPDGYKVSHFILTLEHRKNNGTYCATFKFNNR